MTTRAPSSIAFSAAYCATLPEPEIDTRMPSKDFFSRCSIWSAKYTVPKPVASGRIRLPP